MRFIAVHLVRALGVLALLAATSGPTLAAEPVRLRLIAFNDLHGHLEANGKTVAVSDPRTPGARIPLPAGGADQIAAQVRALRAGAPHSLVVSVGDLVGASPLVSGLFLDEPTIEFANLLGVDVAVLGNHEFDRGLAELQRLARGGCGYASGEFRSCAGPTAYAGARFPMLAANVVDARGTALFPGTWVTSVAGQRVGFVGAVTRSTARIVKPSGIEGLSFEDEAAALNREARALRRAGVGVIVAVVHEGGEAGPDIEGCTAPQGRIFAIERQLGPEIDLVLSAHTHEAYLCRVGMRPVVQGGSYGRLLTVLDLAIDPATGRLLPEATRMRNLPVSRSRELPPELAAAYPAYAPDAAAAALVAHYAERAAPLGQLPAGRIAAPFRRAAEPGQDSAAGRLIADAQLAATRAAGAQLAFTNPGGMRTDLVSRAPDGAVSLADVYAMQPFGNSLVTLSLSGEELLRLLEQQWSADGSRMRVLQPSRGFTYAWDPRRSARPRVVTESVRLDGRRIEAQRIYRITVNSYLAEGGDGFSVLRDGRDRNGGPLDVEALRDYLRAESTTAPLAPDTEARVRRLDGPAP
ncbi:MAG TPA: bifunctional metallophosphatase/5'-nucleotidase [Burkholderiaceae bacterium]|nr:bifunctional metallophosphatase/5'-nucleotidase [Burkholderiaceae bacterium]